MSLGLTLAAIAMASVLSYAATLALPQRLRSLLSRPGFYPGPQLLPALVTSDQIRDGVGIR